MVIDHVHSLIDILCSLNNKMMKGYLHFAEIPQSEWKSYE